MRIYFLLLLSITELFSQKVEHTFINNQPFTIVKEHYNEYGIKGEFMRLYKGKEQNQSKKILTFTLSERDSSCKATESEEGSYEINGSVITLYSSWKRNKKAYDEPEGARVKIYKLLDNGSLKRLSSRVYIEMTKKDYDKDSGMKYIFNEPKTEAEKKALQTYIGKVEKEYDGKFVLKKEAKLVIKEVKEALHRKIQFIWNKKK